MSRVTISMKAARALVFWEGFTGQVTFGRAELDALAELRRAMEPKRKPRKPPRSAFDHAVNERLSRPSKAQKRDRRASIREAVVKRAMDAGGLCECGCGEKVFDDRKTPVFPEARGEMDHFWGRGKGRPPESLETCWFLRPTCHLAKTRNQPDATTWLKKYIAHCQRWVGDDSGDSYLGPMMDAQKRLAFVETRSMLGAGLKEREP